MDEGSQDPSQSFDASDEDRIEGLRDRNRELARRVRALEAALQASSAGVRSIEGLDAMVIRVDEKDEIVYVNQAFADFLGVEKDSLQDQDLRILSRFDHPWIHRELFGERLRKEGSVEVQADNGSTLVVSRSIVDGAVDVVVRDESEKHRYKKYIDKYIGQDLTRLDEQDLETFRFPERRTMSVSFTDLRGFTAMSETMSPEQIRTTMNAYLEEMIYAIELNGATVDKIVGDNVMALYGAPRYYQDHALRAIITAVDQVMHLEALQKVFGKVGRVIPDCGIGIHTGEMVVGNMGSVYRQDYTVLGTAVNLCSRMCNLAESKQIIMTEATLESALQHLPKGWEVRHRLEAPRGLPKHLSEKVEDIEVLGEELLGKVVEVGPEGDPRFIFRYLYQAKVKGIDKSLPVLEVEGKARQGQSMLKETRVEVDNAKIFGSYRLIELIGRGGMGEVWKARDRFENEVAIKMLIVGDMATVHQVNRFRKEAQAMAMLQHRNICRIHEVGEVEGVTFIAMEYVEGITLSELLILDRSQESVDSFTSHSSDIGQLIQEIGKQRQIDHQEKGSGLKNYRILPLQQALSIV